MTKRERLLWFLLIGMLLGAAGIMALAAAGTTATAEPPRIPAGQGVWVTASPMPIYRSEHNAVVLDGKIYVGGGLAGPNQYFTGTTNVFEAYDPATDTWTDLASMPNRLHHFGIASTGGHVYVTGGYDGEDFNPDVSTTYIYTPSTNTWGRGADMPSPRAAHISVAAGGLVYVVGGVTAAGVQLWAYNPATDSWNTSRAPMPTEREHLTAASVNGKLYVIAGRWFSGNIGTVEEYDPATNTWTPKASLPTPRSGLTCAVVDGKIHVTGGEDLFSTDTYNQHEVYDPATDTWATYPPMPTARHGLGSGAVNGRWYVIGGGLLAGNQTYSSLTNIVEAFVVGATPAPTNTPANTPAATATRTAPPPTSTATLQPTFAPTFTPTLTSTATSTPCMGTFSDVPPGSTFYQVITCLACRSIVNGYPDGTFKPNNWVTRGQLSKIVSQSAGFSEPVGQEQTFEDVPPGSTFHVYVERLASREVMGGYQCGISPLEPCGPGNRPYFRPNAGATRGQLTKMVSNAAGFSDTIPPGEYTFADVLPGSTFHLYVERLRLNRPGVMSGYPCGSSGEPCDSENRPYFRPGNPLTRGQTSKIVANTFFPECSK
jgi:N-acetylneuraminic acid mutarotase